MPEETQQTPTNQTSSQPLQENSAQSPLEQATIIRPTTSDPQSDSSSKKKSALLIFLIIVFIAAIGVLFYFWLAPKPTPQPAPTTVELPKSTLVLTAPKDQEATTSAQIEVKGKTDPNSFVTAYTDTQEEIFESDENGNFSGILNLEEGPNEITVTAFGQDAQEQSETRSVVYLTDKEL